MRLLNLLACEMLLTGEPALNLVIALVLPQATF